MPQGDPGGNFAATGGYGNNFPGAGGASGNVGGAQPGQLGFGGMSPGGFNAGTYNANLAGYGGTGSGVAGFGARVEAARRARVAAQKALGGPPSGASQPGTTSPTVTPPAVAPTTTTPPTQVVPEEPIDAPIDPGMFGNPLSPPTGIGLLNPGQWPNNSTGNWNVPMGSGAFGTKPGFGTFNGDPSLPGGFNNQGSFNSGVGGAITAGGSMGSTPGQNPGKNQGRLQFGGPALPGKTYTVGENGPETLRMGRGGGGQVIPHNPADRRAGLVAALQGRFGGGGGITGMGGGGGLGAPRPPQATTLPAPAPRPMAPAPRPMAGAGGGWRG